MTDEALIGAVSGLIGRDAEIAELARALADDRPVVVLGEAGIGKTSLVRAAASIANRPIREGGGFGTLSWLPYLALRRAIDAPVTGSAGDAARAVEQAIGPDLLFIDDLQWVDRESRAALELVGGRVGLVMAVRAGDPGTDAALALARSLAAIVITLDGLDPTAALAVARRARHDLAAPELRRIAERAGGNPLLIEELAVRGTGSTVARSIVAQVRGLGPDERAAAELLAVADRPLPLAALGPGLAALSEFRLATVDAVAGTASLRHGLIGEAIREELEPAVRQWAHGRLASIVEDPLERARHLRDAGRRSEGARAATSGAASETDPIRRARLLAVASELEDPGRADELRVEAGRALRGVGDTLAAYELLRQPVEGSDELLAARAAALLSASFALGHFDEARAVLEAGAELHPDPGSRAAMDFAAARSSFTLNMGGSEHEAIGILEAASAAAGDGARSYVLRGALETMRIFSGVSTDTAPLRAAWDDALAARDAPAVANLGINLHYALLSTAGGRPALAFILEAADRLVELGYPTRAEELRAEACQVAIFAGALPRTVALADTALEQPLDTRARQRALYMRGLALALMGRFDDAEASLEEVATIATDDFDGIGSVRWVQAEFAFWAGSPLRVAELVAEAVTKPALSPHEYILPGLTRAWAERELGRPPTPLVDTPLTRALQGAKPELAGLVAHAAGDHVAAMVAFEEAAATWANIHVTREPLCAWAAGEAARLAGRTGDATVRLEAALASAELLGMTPLAARVRRSLRLLGRRLPQALAARPVPAGFLTRREREVVDLIGRGLTNIEIARRMGLGRPTVSRMISNAMVKLDASSRAQLVAVAVE